MSVRPEPEPSRRFLVTWRDGREQAAIHPVGVLTAGADYTFVYLPRVSDVPGFRAFPGFDDLGRVYRAPSLFLFFADRLMNPRRPDFAAYVEALGLSASPSELDLLSRSEGAVKGDRVTVVEEPAVGADGSTQHAFVVRGVRFALDDPAWRDEVLATISAGSHLTVRPEPENTVSAQALQLVTDEGIVVGWVPDALTPYVSAVLARPGADVSVLRRNGPEQPPHMRLVASIQGWLPPEASPLPQLGSEQTVSLVPA